MYASEKGTVARLKSGLRPFEGKKPIERKRNPYLKKSTCIWLARPLAKTAKK